MALALECRAMKDDIMLGDTPKARKRRRRLKNVQSSGRLWKHSTLADIHGLVEHTDVASFFTFTLVRNPWDRLVSYYHWLQRQRFDHVSVRMAGQMDFSSFVSDERTQASLRAYPARSYMTCADGVERCTSYIRIEAYGEDSDALNAHLGFALPLDQVNRSDRTRGYQSYYSDETARIVGDCCAEDIARFGYCFE